MMSMLKITGICVQDPWRPAARRSNLLPSSFANTNINVLKDAAVSEPSIDRGKDGRVWMRSVSPFRLKGEDIFLALPRYNFSPHSSSEIFFFYDFRRSCFCIFYCNSSKDCSVASPVSTYRFWVKLINSRLIHLD